MADHDDDVSFAGMSMGLYSKRQNVILSAIPHLVGPPSLLGSMLIMYVIWYDRRKLLKNSYDRIILGLAFCDALTALGFTIFGPWAIPESVDPVLVVGARAETWLPCQLSACLLHMMLGTVVYTAGLMVYFILLVRLEWRPDAIAQRAEPWIHVAGLGVPAVTAALAVALDFMNPFVNLPGICWIAPYPPDCKINPNVACERGEGSLNFARGLAGLPLVTVVIVVVAMHLLIIKVRATEERLLRYQIPGGNSSTSTQNNTTSITENRRNSNSRRASATNFQRTRRTAQRGLMYIAAFVASFLPAAVFVYVSIRFPPEQRSIRFLMAILIIFFVPLQGVFNAIIYIQPNWKDLSSKGKSLYWLGLVWNCVYRWCWCCCCCCWGGNCRPDDNKNNQRNNIISTNAQYSITAGPATNPNTASYTQRLSEPPVVSSILVSTTNEQHSSTAAAAAAAAAEEEQATTAPPVEETTNQPTNEELGFDDEYDLTDGEQQDEEQPETTANDGTTISTHLDRQVHEEPKTTALPDSNTPQMDVSSSSGSSSANSDTEPHVSDEAPSLGLQKEEA